jgi:hypothetical protein
MTAQAAENGLRWCPGCKQDLPVSAWFKSTRNGKCRECRKAYQHARYHSDSYVPLHARVKELERIIAEMRASAA